MTAATVVRPELHPQAVPQTVALARRSVVSLLRQPTVLIPGLLFPMLIAAVQSATLGRAIHLPGFPPVDSFLDFVMAATIVQGVLFGGVTGGSDLALDIENGFFERLVASPVARPAILVGRLAGAAAMGAVQAVIFILLFMALGARIDGGLLGALVLVATATLLALGIGGAAAAIGLRTGSAEAVQNTFPLAFILIFLSSAFFPTALMKGWYQDAAEHNPITWMINGLREQVIVGFDLGAGLKALAVAGATVVLGIGLALWQLGKRLARTGA